jgi:ADP-ribosylglycohydrolase
LNYDRLYTKILGSLATSCIGDALGCPTEQLTMAQIKERFGGFVTDFHPTFPGHPFSDPSRKPGQITDDASILLKMAEAIVASRGRLTLASVAEHLLLWSEEPEFRCAGPTTVAAIEALREGGDPAQTGKTGKLTTDGVSNGAAMKVSPAGLANSGDMKGAVADAITICLPTHGTSLAMEGACAIACGVAEALQDGSTVASVVRATLLGADLGKEQCREVVRILPGPSIKKRIELAVSLAMCSGNLEQAMTEIEVYIGNGLPISETVPIDRTLR